MLTIWHDLPPGHARLEYFALLIDDLAQAGCTARMAALPDGQSPLARFLSLKTAPFEVLALNTCHIEHLSDTALRMTGEFALEDEKIRAHPRILQDLTSRLREEFAPHGVEVLGLMRAAEQLYCTREPVIAPRYLRDMRIRIPGGVHIARAVESLAAHPVRMPLRDVRGAVEDGKLDGLSVSVNGWIAETRDSTPYGLLLRGMLTLSYLLVCPAERKGIDPSHYDVLHRAADARLTQSWCAMADDDEAQFARLPGLGLQLQTIAYDKAPAWLRAARDAETQVATALPKPKETQHEQKAATRLRRSGRGVDR